jgi:ketosteroid isomerase-like protein
MGKGATGLWRWPLGASRGDTSSVVPAQNVDLARRLLEAFNAHDLEAFLAMCDPSIEYHSVMTGPFGTAYQGHDGIRSYFRDFADAWGDDFRVEPDAFFDLGEHTLISFVVKARGKQSGAEVSMQRAQLSRWQDGRLVFAKGYVDRHDALKDLGLSEDQLEPIVP